MNDRHPITMITEDIYQLRLPLPFALNHVNVYLLRGSNGWTIVDCGINWEPARAVWQQAFDELGISGTNIEKIILTHVHPDHFGLAGWLHILGQQAGHEIPIYTSPREDQQADAIWRGERMNFRFWLGDNGMPDEMARAAGSSMDDTFNMTLPHPPALQHIHPGTRVMLGEREMQVIHAPGHSDGQLIFYDVAEKLLISGDHVLMTITPNIGLWDTTDPDPLGAYMASLRDVSQLDVTRALPGHRRIIEDWSGRIAELLLHHEHRLDLVMESLQNGVSTPYQVANDIFDTVNFSVHEWRFAIAETLAHLEYLRRIGRVQQDDDRQLFSL